MEHAKKMMLVPPELIQRLTASENVQPNILSQLDEDMQKVLTAKLTDHDKWAQYNQVLQRYLHFTDQTRQPISVPVEFEKDPLKHSTILATLPSTYKRKAENLINILNATGLVDWDRNGTVTIKGEILPSSNIIDLINDTLRPRKNTNPSGWEQFASFMKEVNVPHELIGNPKRRGIDLSQHNTPSKILKTEDCIESSKVTLKATPAIKEDLASTSVGKQPKPRRKILTPADFTDWERLRLD